MDRHSGEGGSTSILNPLALTYQFGRSSATPDRKRTAEITGHPPQPTVKHHVVYREGTDNVRSEASFGHGPGFHSKKREGTDRTRPEARPMQGRGEVGGSYYKNKTLKIPQTGGSPGVFFFRQDENFSQGGFKREQQCWTRASQRES